MAIRTLRVLLVEDDPADAGAVEGMLAEASRAPEAVRAFSLVHAGSLREASQRLQEGRTDVILLDLSLPDGDGMETVAAMRQAAPQVPIVVMSGMRDEGVALRAVREGAQDYLVKGHTDRHDLERAIRYAVERMQTLRALQESRRFLQSTLDALSAHICIVDARGTLLAVNAAWRRLAGRRRLLGSSCRIGGDYLACCREEGEDGRRLAEGIGGVIGGENRRFVMEYPCAGEADEEHWVTVRVTPFEGDGPPRAVVAHEDVTDRVRAEREARRHQAELAHVARVSTMGEMATGLAHELNQPLGAIVNYARGCTRRIDLAGSGPPEVREALERIVEQAVRASEIIRRIRRFVRKAPPRRETAQVNDLVLETLRLADNELRQHEVKTELDLAADLPPVHVDPIQIEQVILNLIRNAVEAMADVRTGPRRLYLRTSRHPQKKAVEVTVRDTGCGITPDVASRAFDQFFSTKNGGLGMGLAISRSIIEAHGGHLEALADAGPGGTFRFWLPASNEGDVNAGESNQ